MKLIKNMRNRAYAAKVLGWRNVRKCRRCKAWHHKNYHPRSRCR